MVTDAQKRRFMREMQEDYQEFVELHRAESRGRRYEYVSGRMIALPGLTLMKLMKFGWVDSNGDGFRPSR